MEKYGWAGLETFNISSMGPQSFYSLDTSFLSHHRLSVSHTICGSVITYGRRSWNLSAKPFIKRERENLAEIEYLK